MIMPKSTGTVFQELIMLSAERCDMACIRLRDAGYRGEQTTERRFTIRNIADFIVYNDFRLLVLEAKSRKTSLAFEDITQLPDLQRQARMHRDRYLSRASSGVLVEFQNTNQVFWVQADAVSLLQKELGKKSFNAKDLLHYGFNPVRTYLPQGKRKAHLLLSCI